MAGFGEVKCEKPDPVGDRPGLEVYRSGKDCGVSERRCVWRVRQSEYVEQYGSDVGKRVETD